MKDKCYKTFSDGRCCCNCKHKIKLMCHPSNGDNKSFGWIDDKIKFGKGSILEQCGWVCKAQLEDNDEITFEFHDFEHGMCELHDFVKVK